MNKNAIEKLLWSIALPGFGQILNQKYIKGILFIFLEFLVNIQSNFTEAIISSFNGFAEYFVTVGLIYSTKVKLFGLLFGPIFLPMLFVIPGVLNGFGLKKLFTIIK